MRQGQDTWKCINLRVGGNSHNIRHDAQDLHWYPVSSVIKAWGLYVAAAQAEPQLAAAPTFLYDLVDLTRQVT